MNRLLFALFFYGLPSLAGSLVCEQPEFPDCRAAATRACAKVPTVGKIGVAAGFEAHMSSEQGRAEWSDCLGRQTQASDRAQIKCIGEIAGRFATQHMESLDQNKEFKEALRQSNEIVFRARDNLLKVTRGNWTWSEEGLISSILAKVNLNSMSVGSREKFEQAAARLTVFDPQSPQSSQDEKAIWYIKGSAAWAAYDAKKERVWIPYNALIELNRPENKLLRSVVLGHEVAHIFTTGLVGGQSAEPYFSEETRKALTPIFRLCLTMEGEGEVLAEDMADMLGARMMDGFAEEFYSQDQINALFNAFCSFPSSQKGHSSGVERVHRLILHSPILQQKLGCIPEQRCRFNF